MGIEHLVPKKATVFGSLLSVTLRMKAGLERTMGFTNDLAYSDTVTHLFDAAYRSLFPTLTHVARVPANTELQRLGVDVVVVLNEADGLRCVTIDEKARRPAWAHYANDITVELISNNDAQTPGWFYTTKADYCACLFHDDAEWAIVHLVPMVALRAWIGQQTATRTLNERRAGDNGTVAFAPLKEIERLGNVRTWQAC